MRYISTRGEAPALNFTETALAGLATDGGLYLPETYPQLHASTIAGLAGRTYAEAAETIIAPFVGDAIPRLRRSRSSPTISSCSNSSMAPRSPSRTWRCNCSAGS